MKATIGLEFFGSNTYDQLNSISKLLDHIKEGLGREFIGDFGNVPCVLEISRGTIESPVGREIYGKRDYSKSNSKGSRGVYVWYVLESDRLYFVRCKHSWRSLDEYFCAVNEDGTIYRLSIEEAREWLSVLSE